MWERDPTICAGAGSTLFFGVGAGQYNLCGTRLCGHGISHSSWDRGIIPNSASNRGIPPPAEKSQEMALYISTTKGIWHSLSASNCTLCISYGRISYGSSLCEKRIVRQLYKKCVDYDTINHQSYPNLPIARTVSLSSATLGRQTLRYHIPHADFIRYLEKPRNRGQLNCVKMTSLLARRGFPCFAHNAHRLKATTNDYKEIAQKMPTIWLNSTQIGKRGERSI